MYCLSKGEKGGKSYHAWRVAVAGNTGVSANQETHATKDRVFHEAKDCERTLLVPVHCDVIRYIP